MSKRACNVKVGDEYWYRGAHLGTITAVTTKYTFIYRDKNGNTNSSREYDSMDPVLMPPSRKCVDVEPGDTIECNAIWRIVSLKRRNEDGFVEFVFADSTAPQRVIYKNDDLVRIGY
jgi:hypothetical protein